MPSPPGSSMPDNWPPCSPPRAPTTTTATRCKTLASDDRSISPTRFHNSVHNAPAGYWGIASGAMTPATVLCAHDASFGAGLLEALTQLAVDGSLGFERGGTLLIAYDMPIPSRCTPSGRCRRRSASRWR